MTKKLCLIYNIPSLYRESIYKMIDQNYDCDWYFGSTTSGIREMNTNVLKNVKRYKILGNTEKVFWNVGMLKLLFKKEYQTYFMLFETRCLTTWVFFWLAFLFFKDKKFYIWTHGWYGKETGIEAKMKMWVYRHVTGIFVYGERAKKLLEEQGISPKKIFAIHNSLDYDKQKIIRESLKPSLVYFEHFGNNAPVIIFIGRLTKVKQLDLLVDALAELKERGELYNLVFIGDGVEGNNLQKKVHSLGISDQVWFYGASYDEKINAELIFNADLCVAPGNIGLTAMHVLMFGCPAISHNDFKWQMPEFEAIQDGKTGTFFQRGNKESLVSVISKWFSVNGNKRDRVRKTCYTEIDERWNPLYQINLIKEKLIF